MLKLETQRPTQRRASGERRREAGLALPAVILVMVLVSALALASLMTTGDERAAGRALRESAKAFYAAEAGANALVANWDNASYDTLMAGPGDSLDLGWQTLENAASYKAVLTRVDGGSGERMYAARVTGRGVGGLRGQRTVGVVLRWKTSSIATFTSAIFAATELRKNSNEGGISGADVCGEEVDGLKINSGGLQYNDTTGTQVFFGDSTILWNGTSTQSVVEVDDPLAELQATGLDWDGIKNGTFDYTIPGLPGDPTKPDMSYWPDFSAMGPDEYPLIGFAPTILRVNMKDDYNGRGLLVIAEELRINGGFEWDGIILVGNYMQSNGNMTIQGGVMTGLDLLLGRDPSDMKLSAIGPGTAQITYNSCMIEAASESVAGPSAAVPLSSGAWSQASS